MKEYKTKYKMTVEHEQKININNFVFGQIN